MNIGKNNPSKEEKRKQKIVEKERKQYHNELIKEANKTYNEEKIAPNDSFISLVNVNKIYDNHVQAVFNFNLDIKENEFIVFVGPSGCGKSTTLRMIAGLEDITYGDLFIQGKYSNITPPKDRDLAMVFQSYALYPHMSVYDNMAFGLKIKKVKMPVYKKNDCKLINKRIIKLEKELNKLNSINKDDSTNKTRIEEINNEINNLKEKYNEEFKKSKEIDTFIDKKTIINKNKKVKEIEKEIALTNSKINELSKIDYSTLHNLKDKHEQLKTKYFETQSTLTNEQKNDLSKEASVLHDQIETLERKQTLLVKLDERIENLNKKLDKEKEDIEYLSTHEVPKYTYRKLNKEEIKERVLNAASILQLEEYLKRKPGALSGGQRQRVALGRAIVRNSRLFLMDEPLSNLDAKLRVQMRSEIVSLHQKLGSTTIYVTHDQTEAMTMASRIVVMKGGYIQQIGTPIDIYDSPSNTFVAGFIGSPAMNIFECKLHKNTIIIGDKFKIKLRKNRIDHIKQFSKNKIEELTKKIEFLKNKIFDENDNSNFSKAKQNIYEERITKYNEVISKWEQYNKGDEITLKFGIRPEDIITGDDLIKFKDLSDEYVGTVTIAEFLGHEYFIHFDFEGNYITAKIPVTKNLLKADSKVLIKLNLDKIHLFDNITEEAIF